MKTLNLLKALNGYLKQRLQKKAELRKQKEALKQRIEKCILDYANLRANPSRYSKKMRNLIQIEFNELVEMGHIEFEGTWD